MPLDLLLPFLQRDEHLVVPLRDGVEELEGVLEVRERAGAEHRVEPDRTFTHVGLGGALVQQLLSRLDLSREHRDPLTDPRRLRLDRLDRLLDLVELLEETNDLLAKVFGARAATSMWGVAGPAPLTSGTGARSPRGRARL